MAENSPDQWNHNIIDINNYLKLKKHIGASKQFNPSHLPCSSCYLCLQGNKLRAKRRKERSILISRALIIVARLCESGGGGGRRRIDSRHSLYLVSLRRARSHEATNKRCVCCCWRCWPPAQRPRPPLPGAARPSSTRRRRCSPPPALRSSTWTSPPAKTSVRIGNFVFSLGSLLSSSWPCTILQLCYFLHCLKPHSSVKSINNKQL